MTHATVDGFLDALDPTQRATVDVLRGIVLGVRPDLHEHLKWNAPSYVHAGQDRMTFAVRPGGPVRLVLHAGATTREDKGGEPVLAGDTGLLTWHSDIRASMVFHDSAEITARAGEIADVLRRWLEMSPG